MLRVVVRNILSNWAGFAINALVVFFLTPFVLSRLGATRYGIWVTVTGWTGYFGLLDLGFKAGITQYLTRHLAKRDFVEMNRTASTATLGMCLCGAVVAVASLLLAALAPIFKIPVDAVTEVRLCFLIIGLKVAVEFCFFTYSAVFAATQRYDLANLISVAIRLITAAGTVVALRAGYGLVGLCAITSAGDLVGYLLRWRIAQMILPQLSVSLHGASLQNLRPMLTFGLANLVIQGAVTLKSSSAELFIPLVLPISAVTPFALPVYIVMYFERLFAPMAMVFFPVATQLDARGDRSALREIYLRGSKTFLVLGIVGGMIGLVWAEDFFRLWIDAELSADESVAVVHIFWILMLATIFAIGQRIGLQCLLGSRRAAELAAILSIEAVLYLAIAVALIFPLGIAGVAWGMCIATVIVQGIVLPLVVCRSLEIRPWRFVYVVYLRAGLVAAALFAPLLLVHRAIPVGSSWTALVVCGAIASGTGLLAVLILGLDAYERRRLVLEPLLRLGIRLGLVKTAEPAASKVL